MSDLHNTALGMTQLAKAQAQTQEIVPQNQAKAALNALWQHAKMLSESDLVPQAYRGKPANCVIAIELATRLGSAPLMVMQSLDVIHGNPSWRSKFLIAAVNATKRFTPIRFRETGKGTKDWSCVAYACDIDPKTGEVGPELEGPEVSLKMADAEGWLGKSGSKWKTMPQLMLMYRAAAFWSRVYAPEVSMGLHTVEEQEDIRETSVRSAMPDEIRAALLTEGATVVVPETRQSAEADSSPESEQTKPRMREPGED